MANPNIDSIQDLTTSDARWIGLKKISYTDADGKQRLWEMAERRTRSSGGIDAVAILTILRSKADAFPVSTVIIEQYRPPIDKFVIELPAGLIDQGESPEQSAIRELEEETGYKADSVIDVTPVIVSDPGMTNANMKLVTVSVTLEDKLEAPQPKLEIGEHIVTRVIPLKELHQTLSNYDKKGFAVDARLFHLAAGYKLAGQLSTSE
ncbi:hypothetical protein FA15DRAFT_704017 [Coprinopsis marcescibilis]|uniref:Nudix hydrolase domain-containing protein n=1 Tax=Coprinopsis marcescibilis TaxID=230819 RepID=A0A5C3L9T2_COPMA|nr:hypothetical protein FA15DRAFT_704017 [Coprinopsis marcescibilis]